MQVGAQRTRLRSSLGGRLACRSSRGSFVARRSARSQLVARLDRRSSLGSVVARRSARSSLVARLGRSLVARPRSPTAPSAFTPHSVLASLLAPPSPRSSLLPRLALRSSLASLLGPPSLPPLMLELTPRFSDSSPLLFDSRFIPCGIIAVTGRTAHGASSRKTN